jgi:transcriptional regulator with XRE-family HTH domain
MTQHEFPDTSGPWVPVDSFGARLALVRQSMKWNVSQAAKACGVPAASWTTWERGARCRDVYEVARRVADATGVDYAWLMVGGPLGDPIRSRCLALTPLVRAHVELIDLPPGNDAPAFCRIRTHLDF